MKKPTCILFAATALLLVACGSSKPSDTVKKYLTAEKNSNYAAAYDCISDVDKKTKSFQIFENEKKSEFGIFTDKIKKENSFTILNENISGEQANVTVELREKDYSSLLTDMLGQAFSSALTGSDAGTIAQNFSDKLASNDIPIINKTVVYNLSKEDGKWVIFFNWEKEIKIDQLKKEAEDLNDNKKYELALEKYIEINSLDPSLEYATNAITELREKLDQLQKRKDYIKNISLYDFKSRYYTSWLSDASAGVEFKLKNNGDKTLSKVKVTVYFKDATETVIHEENFYPVNSNNIFSSGETLKPNHIWQLERRHYYEANKVPSEWKEGSAYAEITDVEFE